MVTPNQPTLGALLELSDHLRLDTHSVLFDSIRRSDNPDFYPSPGTMAVSDFLRFRSLTIAAPSREASMRLLDAPEHDESTPLLTSLAAALKM